MTAEGLAAITGALAMPISGRPAELLHAAGIDAEAIATAARQLLGQDSVTSAS